MDIDCPFDLTCRRNLPKDHLDQIQETTESVILSTANSIMKCAGVVPQQIGSSGDFSTPYVMEGSPDVLNVGQRCEKEGY